LGALALDWQTAAVIAIEAFAIAFLIRRLFVGRGPAERTREEPDVPVSALVRRRRRPPNGYLTSADLDDDARNP
jgi:hypothetical protein